MKSPETSPQYFPRILHIAEVGSTNAEALRLAAFGELGPVWIRADRQTEGKGRSGRLWTSEPGNLFASLLVPLDIPPAKASQLSLVAGVAVIEAIREAVTFDATPDLRLKWPNDILVGRAKAGGILVESSSITESAAARGLIAVVGIGINLVSHPDLGRAATHLAAHGTVPEAHVLLEHIARSMDRWMIVWSGGDGFPSIRKAWLESAHPLGERMSINTGSAAVEGEFAGLDFEGALILHVAGKGEMRFTFGDVALPA